jgi:hypothetical protein
VTQRSWPAWTVLCLAFAVSVGVFALSNSKLTRIAALAHSEACQLALQTSLSARTRIAAIGSSRTRVALNPAYLSQLLGLGPEGVVNLGRPGIDPAYYYGTIADLSGDHSFDLVMVEVLAGSDALTEAEATVDPRPAQFLVDLSAGAVRPSFMTGIGTHDQARRLLYDAPNVAVGLSDFFTVTADRITTTLALVRREEIYPKLYVTTSNIDPDAKMVCALRHSRDDAVLSPERRQRRQDKIDGYRALFETEGWVDPDPFGFLTQDSSAVDRATLREMIALSDARGFALVFYYLPGTYVPVSPELAPAFEAQFGVPLLIAPPALRAQLDEGQFYYDNSHLTTAGSHMFLDWLATQIDDFLVEVQQ